MQEDIRKNEFVAEYTGELINHKEADRRGKAYDRDSNTYLFDLNEAWVIDAKQRGNKMRFANHRSACRPCQVCIGIAAFLMQLANKLEAFGFSNNPA